MAVKLGHILFIMTRGSGYKACGETGNAIKEEERDNRDGDDQRQALHAAPPQREAGGRWLEIKTGR